MLNPGIEKDLPPIPAKRYFTIGEASELCGVKPHVLRYWEQGFTIGGARQQLEGESAHDDVNRSQQIIRQVRLELEQVLHALKR